MDDFFLPFSVCNHDSESGCSFFEHDDVFSKVFLMEVCLRRDNPRHAVFAHKRCANIRSFS